jgi:hypothetical protein
MVRTCSSRLAATPAAKRAKVEALFAHVLCDKWRAPQGDADWDVESARALIFELPGVEASDFISEKSEAA